MISDFAIKCSIFRRSEKSLKISDRRFSLVLAVIWVWKSAGRRFFVFVLVSNTVQIMFSFGIFSLWVYRWKIQERKECILKELCLKDQQGRDLG